MDNTVVVILFLSIAIVLLLLVLLILAIYVAFIKWKKYQRRRSERGGDGEFRMSLINTVNPHTQSITSMTGLQTMARENMKAIPAYDPDMEDEEFQNGSDPICGPCVSDSGVLGKDLKVSHEQLDLITPDRCGSGRLDSELIELLKTDMTESTTVKVDSKLLVFISREIDDLGGTLVLDKMGISLLIPPCAIPRGKKQIIQLASDWELSDYPPMTDTQTIISPVVHCGPHGLKLLRPAILSLMHCGDDVQDIAVLSSETHLTQDKHWKPIQHRKKCGKVQYALLENQCQVYLSHFSLYTCIAQGSHPRLTKKWIQLAAFGKKEGGQFQVFIYMLNNTPCALQFAIYQQSKYNCSMIRCPLEFLLDEEGGDLVFDLKHVSEGWNPVGRKWEEIGRFLDIWQEKCNNISFIFKHDNPSCTDLNFNICLFQKDMPDVKRHFEVAMSFPCKNPTWSTAESQSHATTNLTVHVTQAVPSIVTNGLERSLSSTPSETAFTKSTVHGGDRRYDDPVINDKSTTANVHDNDLSFDRGGTDDAEVADTMLMTSSHSKSTNTTNINIHTEMIVQPPPDLPDNFDLLQDDLPAAVFPLRLRSKLMALLDPPSSLTSSVNDWRVLAESLNLDSLVSLIRMKPSPTEELLDVAAQKGKDCRWLYGVLRDAERYDAVDEVAKYLGDGIESLRLNTHVEED
eukprot:XP_011676914.1 PREDICTED: netrin receptor UNC5B-like [Strongylocentrotus purpuratus]